MHSRTQLLRQCRWGHEKSPCFAIPKEERSRDLEGQDMGLGFNSTTCWDHVVLGKAQHFMKPVFPESHGPKSCQSHRSSRSQWNDVDGSALQTEKGCLGAGFSSGELGTRLLSCSKKQLLWNAGVEHSLSSESERRPAAAPTGIPCCAFWFSSLHFTLPLLISLPHPWSFNYCACRKWSVLWAC